LDLRHFGALVFLLAIGYPQPLPIPPLNKRVKQNGKKTFNLLMADGTIEFLSVIQTSTPGYNGSYLCPTLLMGKEEDRVILNILHTVILYTANLDLASGLYFYQSKTPINCSSGKCS